MRKSLLLILLLALIHLSGSGLKAQDKGLMASFGVATFQMDDLKGFQEYILSLYPVEGKIISSFPAWTAYSVNFFKQVYPMIQIGAGYTYTSTGGKSDYSDFSGRLSTTMIAISHRFGAYVNYTFLSSDHLALSLFGRLDANLSRLNLTSELYTARLENAIVDTYKSISPNASAGLELMYNLKKFSIGVDGAYLVDFPAKLKSTDDGSELYDPENPEEVLTTDWSGWRTSIKAILWF